MSQVTPNNPESRKRGDGGIVGAMSGSKKFWKSMDEFADSSSYREYVEREFPESASELLDPVSRRSFLGIMASSMALAGVTGCNLIRRPEQKILPYNNQPEEIIPGRPLYFATTMAIGEEVTGLVIESHEGRPTKVEGNPNHPGSMGAASKFNQASILELYNPDRAKSVSQNGKDSNWESLWSELGNNLSGDGSGVRVLSEYITSPSVAQFRQKFLEKYPNARWHSYESVNSDNEKAGLKAATGLSLSTLLQLDKAMRVLSIDCDFLGTELNQIPNTKNWVKLRDPDKGSMSRLYMAESLYSVTGSRADHRLKLKPTDLGKFLWLVADELFNHHNLALPAGLGPEFKSLCNSGAGLAKGIHQDKWVKTVAADLLKSGGSSLVCVGKSQEPGIHALAFAINMALGAVGRTVQYKKSQISDFNEVPLNSVGSLRELTFAMSQNKVNSLIIIGGNPAYSAPSDIPFAKELPKVKNSFHFTLEANETSALAHWVAPRSHFLESWGDAAAIDGSLSIAQPLIQPLYDTKSTVEFVAGLAGETSKNSYELVQGYWLERTATESFSGYWNKWIHDGLIANTQAPNVAAPIETAGLSSSLQKNLESIRKLKIGELELVFAEHPCLFDGRYANNPWLQELPDPMSRLTWDNAAIMSVKTAEKYGLKNSILLEELTGTPLGKYNMPLVEISHRNQKLVLPAYVLPGLADDTVYISLGYGRTQAGKVGTGTGFNAALLQTGHDYYMASSASLRKTGGTYALASVQEHWSMEGRDLVRVETNTDSHNEHHGHGAYPSLFKEHDYSEGMQWGMVIDLNKCTGCGNCVTACQAENNIPIVGKSNVLNNREMHWIRIDRYFEGDMDNPSVVHQGVACQQCEMAPCETVCPVAATVHSSEGLNDMAYNRCIGTRYCSNNCPYKVRRFNFFNYTNEYTETEKMGQNPDVSVRFRGVMEKCSYCVQRINEQRIVHKNKGEEVIADGAVVPACQQTCPADAIVFGNINDKKSKVAELKHNHRNYDLLAETNSRPRTSYLSRVVNPNPALASETSHGGHS